MKPNWIQWRESTQKTRNQQHYQPKMMKKRRNYDDTVNINRKQIAKQWSTLLSDFNACTIPISPVVQPKTPSVTNLSSMFRFTLEEGSFKTCTKSSLSDHDFNPVGGEKTGLEKPSSAEHLTDYIIRVYSCNGVYKLDQTDKDYLMDKLDQAILNITESVYPQVVAANLTEGIVSFKCVDEISSDWIKSIIWAVEPPNHKHPGYLVLGPGDRKYTPFFDSNVNIEKSLYLMIKCNRGMERKKFHITYIISENDSKTLVIVVERDMIELLRRKNFCPLAGCCKWISFKEIPENAENYNINSIGVNVFPTVKLKGLPESFSAIARLVSGGNIDSLTVNNSTNYNEYFNDVSGDDKHQVSMK